MAYEWCFSKSIFLRRSTHFITSQNVHSFRLRLHLVFTHTHTHTHTHTRTYACMHTCMHACTHPHARTHTQPHTYTYTHTHTDIHWYRGIFSQQWNKLVHIHAKEPTCHNKKPMHIPTLEFSQTHKINTSLNYHKVCKHTQWNLLALNSLCARLME